MQKILKWFTRILLGIVAVAALTAATIMTSPGQHLFISVVEYAAASKDQRVEFGKLEGSLLSSGRFDRIALSDREGNWLEVLDARFSWNPLALLAGRLEVSSLLVDRVAVRRSPVADEATTQSSDADELPLIAVAIDRLEVKEIALGKPVLGTSASFRLAGSAKIVDQKQGLTAHLKVIRTDGPGGDLAATLAYVPERRQLEISASASEPAGGLVANMLDLPGAPPLAFALDGRGALETWQAQWSLSASGKPFVAGAAAINAVESDDAIAYQLTTGFEGYLASLLPKTVQPIFKGKTVGSLVGLWTASRTYEARAIKIKSDTLELSASGGYAEQGSYLYGSGNVRIARADTQPLSLLLDDGSAMSFQNLHGKFDLPNQHSARALAADLSVTGLVTPWGKLDEARLAAQGKQAEPVGRNAFRIDDGALKLTLLGIAPADENLSSVLGPSVSAAMKGSGDLDSFSVQSIAAQTAAVRLDGTGAWKHGSGKLTANVVASDLSKFSALAGETLTGNLSATLTASFADQDRSVEVALEGKAIDAGLKASRDGQGQKSILSGTTTFGGKVAWAGSTNWQLVDVRIAHPKLSIRADGQLQSGAIAAVVKARLNELAVFSSSLAGAMKIDGSIEGDADNFKTSMSAMGDQVAFKGKPVTDLEFTLTGAGPTTDHRGKFSLKGAVEGRTFEGSSNLAVSESGDFAIDQLNLAFGSAQLTGTLRKTVTVPFTGQLSLSAPKLAEFSIFANEPLGGALRAAAEFGGTREHPRLKFSAHSEHSQLAGEKIKRLQAQGEIQNYLTAMTGQAEVSAGKVESDKLTASDLRFALRPADKGMKLNFDANVNGAKAHARGRLVQSGADLSIDLEDLRLAKDDVSLKLDGPGQLVISNGILNIRKFGVSASGGRAVVSGKIGSQDTDAKLVLTKLPASLANLLAAELGLRGTIDGSIALKGAIAKPAATANLQWHDATASETRELGLPPLKIALKGELLGKQFQNRITVSGADGLNLIVTGAGNTSQANKVAQRLAGQIPLALGNAVLAARGTRLGGKIIIDANVTGTLEKPQISGALDVAAATVNDPDSGLRLNDLNGRALLTGERIVIDGLRGTSPKGGSVTVSGNVDGVLTGQPITQVALRIDGLKFDDSERLAGEVDGNLTLAGPVSQLNASGTIYIKRLDITVPNQLPRTVAALDLRHVNAPPHLRAAAAQKDTSSKRPRGEDEGISLNIGIDAADRIFVRGRGVDAQLGGNLKLSGKSLRPAAIGGFDLVRGRLSILGRQLDFKRGKISFNGNLDPYLDFEASAVADDVTATVNVSGPLSKLSFGFSSVPDLPEDEVVAKLLFNKSLAKLSPLQIAQLANEVDKIGGLSSGPGVLDQLKSSVGVDVLDIGTDKTGGATVSAGSYLNDQTYVGVQQGTGASTSRVIIDHDLTKNLKAKGEVGADGKSKVGIGVEWEY